MDEDLAELRRQHISSPEDAELALRYEAALRRAGQREELNALYRLAFACPLAWSALPGEPLDRVRSCATCARDVHYVQTREELTRWVSLGECVALDPLVLTEAVRVLADLPLTEPVRRPGQLCVIEVRPGEVSDTSGLRGGFLARTDSPMSDLDARAVDELLAEAALRDRDLGGETL